MLEAWIAAAPLTTGYENDHGATTILPYSGKSGFSYPLLLGLGDPVLTRSRARVLHARPRPLAHTATRRLLKEYRYLVGLMLLFVCGCVSSTRSGGLGTADCPGARASSCSPRCRIDPDRGAHPARVRRRLRERADAARAPLSGWVGVSGGVADLSTLDFCVGTTRRWRRSAGTRRISSLWHPLVHSRRSRGDGGARGLLRARLRLPGAPVVTRLAAAVVAESRAQSVGGRMAIVNNVSTMPRLELIPKAEFDRVRAAGARPCAPRRHVPRERAHRSEARRLGPSRLDVQRSRPRRPPALRGAEHRRARVGQSRPRHLLLVQGPRRSGALCRAARARRDSPGAAAAAAPPRRPRRPSGRRRSGHRGELGLARDGHLEGPGDGVGEDLPRPLRGASS